MYNELIVGRSWNAMLCMVGVTGVYALLLLTQDIQEDAFITFRVAFNLADHGVFSFNLDEHYNSVTSFLYPLGVAGIRIIFGAFAIPVVQVMNALVVLWICWIVARMLRDLFDIHVDRQWLMWVLLSLLPHTLVLAVRSMEMPYVMLLFVLALRELQKQSLQRPAVADETWTPSQGGFGLWFIGILPFVRPDAIAFSLIVVGVAFFIRKRLAVGCMMATLVALAGYLLVNDMLLGSVLPNTIEAKTISYKAFSFLGLFSHWTAVMNEVAFPVDVKYLYFLKPFCGMSAIVVIGLLFGKLWHKKREHALILIGIIVAVFAIPSAYVIGGVIFPWYLWPSQFLCASVVLGGAMYGIQQLRTAMIQKLCWSLVMGCVILMMSFQLMRSYNWGIMEGVYRARIGQYIAGVSKGTDTLFLEPAGYIPFYAKIKTIDEIGLTSPIVLKYKRESMDNWWMNCVKQERPTFLVQREYFSEYRTHHGYVLTADEIRWFNEHYKMIKHFRYAPKDYTDSVFFQRLLKFSSTHDYYVFKLF